MKAIIFSTKDAAGHRSKFVAVCEDGEVGKTIGHYIGRGSEIIGSEVVPVSQEHLTETPKTHNCVNKVQERLLRKVNAFPFEEVRDFVIKQGAWPRTNARDARHIAQWLEGAPKEVKMLFSSTFDNGLEDGLRVCDACGKWITEGYYLDGDYACSDECAVALYQRYMWDADTPDHKVSKEAAEKQLRYDLEKDDEECIGDNYYTEWESEYPR